MCMGERHAFSRWAATAMEHIEKAAQWGLAAAVVLGGDATVDAVVAAADGARYGAGCDAGNSSA